jgi:hypothetical protein
MSDRLSLRQKPLRRSCDKERDSSDGGGSATVSDV